MNIAVFSSPAHTIPHREKRILAPWVLTDILVQKLVSRGHTVTLFAPVGSETVARLETGDVPPCGAKRDKFGDTKDYYAYLQAQSLLLFRHMIACIKPLGIEVIHIHQGVEQLYPAIADVPKTVQMVYTFHDPIGPGRIPALTQIARLPNMHYVSISKAQMKSVSFPFADVVYNGVDTELFQPDDMDIERKFLIAGRIVPEKGFEDAIEATKRTGERLMMVGQNFSNKAETKEYFDTHIQPAIDGKTIFWESVLKQEHLVAHYQQAKALLFPIHWEEPFGLVMTEAMACGTPVIAYNRGSVPEVVIDGLTGFVIEPTKGVDGLVEAMGRVGEIDRAACRRHVVDHFSIDRMIEGYEKVYKSVCA